MKELINSVSLQSYSEHLQQACLELYKRYGTFCLMFSLGGYRNEGWGGGGVFLQKKVL